MDQATVVGNKVYLEIVRIVSKQCSYQHQMFILIKQRSFLRLTFASAVKVFISCEQILTKKRTYGP